MSNIFLGQIGSNSIEIHIYIFCAAPLVLVSPPCTPGPHSSRHSRCSPLSAPLSSPLPTVAVPERRRLREAAVPHWSTTLPSVALSSSRLLPLGSTRDSGVKSAGFGTEQPQEEREADIAPSQQPGMRVTKRNMWVHANSFRTTPHQKAIKYLVL